MWRGFDIESGNVETSFNYCTIDGAGSIEASLCNENKKTAIALGGWGCGEYPGRGAINNCTISDSGGHAIGYRLTDTVTVGGNTYTGNTQGSI